MVRVRNDSVDTVPDFINDNKKSLRMRATVPPTDEFSIANFAGMSPKDIDPEKVQHVEVYTSPNVKFVFSVKTHPNIAPQTIAINKMQRIWASISLNQDLDVRPFQLDKRTQCIGTIMLEVDIMHKKAAGPEHFDSDTMAQEFLMQFSSQAFTVGQILAFAFTKKRTVSIKVLSIEVMFGGDPVAGHFLSRWNHKLLTWELDAVNQLGQ